MMSKLSFLQHWRKSPAILCAIGFGLLALLGNIAFVVVIGLQTGGQSLLQPGQQQSQNIVQVTVVDDKRVLATTLQNELRVIEQDKVIQTRQFPNPIGGIAVTSDTHTIYIGTADGKVFELNDALETTRQFAVNGRIVGMRPDSQDGILVAHGVGTYSENYFVSHFPAQATSATTTTKTNFTITTLDAAEETVIYGTANSQVGLFQVGEQQVRWANTLFQPISQVLRYAPNRVLAGDDQGNLILLDDQGQTIWAVNVSTDPLRNLAFDQKTSTIFVADTQGQLYALDQDGNILTNQRAASGHITAILPQASGELLLVPRNGSWQSINPAVVPGLALEKTLRPFWYGFNIVALGGFALSLIFAIRRLRASARALLIHVKRARLAYLFTLPAMIMVVLFNYYPAGMALYYSFTSFSLQDVTRFVGIQNYINVLFNDAYFRVGALNMVILIITGILKTVTFPLLAAELVFWLRNNVHRYIFRTLFILPAVVPGLVLTFMWRMVFQPDGGLLNQLLESTGLGHLQRAWLGNEESALWAIVGIGFPFISAFTFLIYLGGLLNINGELYDAARVDGAGWLRRFLNIDIPMLVPQFRVLLFFVLTGTIQGFTDIFLLTQGGPGTATYVPALQMYTSIADGKFGYASAIGVVLFVMIFILTVLVMRTRRQSIEETV